MADISGMGVELLVSASETFPVGFQITEFSDDADPIDTPSVTIADTGMGLNGTLISWSSANPIPLTINVIPGSAEDVSLAMIGDVNRAAKGRSSQRDVITIVVVFGNGATATYTGGKMTDYMPINSVASSGRMKSKAYSFMFEDVVTTPPTTLS